jgi:predicted RNA binding protein YcfA (HicA-like mRNA interferase family)
MGAGFYRDIRALLLQYGCVMVRQGKGSHEVWRSPLNHRSFTVAVTVDSRIMANEILKQAGIGQRL